MTRITSAHTVDAKYHNWQFGIRRWQKSCERKNAKYHNWFSYFSHSLNCLISYDTFPLMRTVFDILSVMRLILLAFQLSSYRCVDWIEWNETVRTAVLDRTMAGNLFGVSHSSELFMLSRLKFFIHIPCDKLVTIIVIRTHGGFSIWSEFAFHGHTKLLGNDLVIAQCQCQQRVATLVSRLWVPVDYWDSESTHKRRDARNAVNW